MCELDVVAKKRHAIMDKATLLEKHIRIPDLEQFMWIQTEIMINMLRGWSIRKILMRKKTRLLKQGLFLCFQ